MLVGIIPLCLGDTFHNLRTALDLMACDLVRIEGNSTDGVSFPFAKNADGFEIAIRRSNSSRMSVEAIELLKNIAPYYGGNDLLRGIHEFDIIDKHRLITPVYQSAFFESLIIRTPEGGAEYNYDCSYSGSYGWRFTKGSKIEHSGMRVEARFDSDGPTPFAGTAILPVLGECAKTIHHTIASFEALYPKNT